MDIRTLKTNFLESSDLTDEIRKAVSLAIDCMIDNHNGDEDIPLVITSYDDSCRDKVLEYVREFCVAAYPGADKDYFIPEMLHIYGGTSEEACISLVNMMRRTKKSILFWAESPSWFSGLPDELFHVVSIDRKKVTRGLNKKATTPAIIKKEYRIDTLLSELFLNGPHMVQNNANNIQEADWKFLNECNVEIIRPIPAPAGASYDEEITINSPDWQKLACVALRRYQARECRDGMHWDTSDDGWNDVVAYPFVEEIQSVDNSSRRKCLVGLVTINISDASNPYLSTVWIHPFHRRQGLLKGLWPELQKRYGRDFAIEQPNESMKAFLKKVKHADDHL